MNFRFVSGNRRLRSPSRAWPGRRRRTRVGDFKTNEIAINWNAALVYALAAFLPK
jgi:hypothetical protein